MNWQQWLEHAPLLAGVDEAGRGPLAGPVVAAAVILDPENSIAGLDDSKKLTAKKRAVLAEEIKEKALSYSIQSCDATLIDQINILQATLLAMKKAVESLSTLPSHVLVDGNQRPDLLLPLQTIVKGDQRVAAISAASILAKVDRDQQMLVYHQQYPQYGFDQHKGYPTKAHIQALKLYGSVSIHRQSFRPVRLANQP